MKRGFALCFSALALALVALPGLLTLLGVRGENFEKRALAEPPQLIADGAVNTRFFQQAVAWFDDRFALRGEMVSTYGTAMEAVLGDSPNAQVIVGREGTLLFTPTLHDYLRDAALPQADIDELATRLRALDGALEERGIDFYFMVGPNKNTIYPEWMPARYRPLEVASNLERLEKALAGEAFYVDTRGALLARKGEDPLYYKLDSHWNALGAAIAYDELLLRMGASAEGMQAYSSLNYYFRAKSDGDLASMIYPTRSVKDREVLFDAHYTISPKESYPFTASPPMRTREDIKIRTQASPDGYTEGPSMLIYRDSFANALIPFLASNTQEALFSRAVPYDLSLLEEIDADIVVLEIVERNIPELLTHLP